MSTNLNFLSFLSANSVEGEYSVTVTTTNRTYVATDPYVTAVPSNVTFTLVATGIGANYPPASQAAMAFAQFNSQLAASGLLYGGVPSFSYQTPAATFRLGLTDHVISFFSESTFNLSSCSNTLGSIVNIGPRPSLLTIPYIRANAGLVGVGLQALDGSDIGDAQLALLSSVMSSRLIAALGNNYIVICTFVLEDTGNWQTDLKLNKGLPGIDFDGVRVKPIASYIYSIYAGYSPKSTWNYMKDKGRLRYVPAQNLVNTYEPVAWGNEIRCSYTAGNAHIPEDILFALLQLMNSSLANSGGGSAAGIKSLKTGTFEVQYFDKKAIDAIVSELVTYNLYYI